MAPSSECWVEVCNSSCHIVNACVKVCNSSRHLVNAGVEIYCYDFNRCCSFHEAQ